MTCPGCQQEHPSAATFCPACGTPLDAARRGFYAELQADNERLKRQLGEASEQQTATAEILRVISSSHTDAQPVFEAIAATALRLCDANLCTVFRFDGELIHLVALHQVSAEGAAAYRDAYPVRPGRAGGTHRAVLTGSIVHIRDIREDPEYELEALARANDFGCVIAVPMLRDGAPIGVITVSRAEARPFTASQITLLETFADQAVIAIENARLFTELQTRNRDLSEALDQQTATAEILRVVSNSPTDLQPVFDTIVDSVVRLCDGVSGFVYRFDGELIHLSAHHHTVSSHAREIFERRYPAPPSRASMIAQAILDRAVVHVRDFETDKEAAPASREMARAANHRSTLAVPMLHHGRPIGAIAVGRRGPQGEPRPFSDAEIELLKTFADQAVIAIENVRLFTELQTRNQDLGDALEKQTATSEILRVISQSQKDAQPVFETIVRNAVRLCGATTGGVYRFDGELIHSVAHEGLTPEQIEDLRRTFPIPVTAPRLQAQAIRTRRVVRTADLEADPVELSLTSQASLRSLGARSLLAVPMFRQDQVIGAISLSHRQVDAFSDAHVELLQTFAAQAVIAIENVRLFKELEARNRDLSEALEQQTATAEILRVISRSQTDVQPVFDTIVRSAVTLCDGLFSAVYQFDGELLHLVAQHNFTPEALEVAHRDRKSVV